MLPPDGGIARAPARRHFPVQDSGTVLRNSRPAHGRSSGHAGAQHHHLRQEGGSCSRSLRPTAATKRGHPSPCYRSHGALRSLVTTASPCSWRTRRRSTDSSKAHTPPCKPGRRSHARHCPIIRPSKLSGEIAVVCQGRIQAGSLGVQTGAQGIRSIRPLTLSRTTVNCAHLLVHSPSRWRRRQRCIGTPTEPRALG